MVKYLDLRKKSYLDRRSDHVKNLYDIDNWRNPYSCIKSRIYIELSTIFAFFLQFTSITPNHISIIYGLSGVLAGAFLVTGINTLMIVGLIIFFFKRLY